MITLNDIDRRISPHLQSPFFVISESKNNRSALSRTAAVLIIVHSEKNIPHILLTRRSSKLKYHTGEISFPGGQYSPGQDRNLLDTALRETREEVGLSFKPSDILGTRENFRTSNSCKRGRLYRGRSPTQNIGNLWTRCRALSYFSNGCLQIHIQTVRYMGSDGSNLQAVVR